MRPILTVLREYSCSEYTNQVTLSSVWGVLPMFPSPLFWPLASSGSFAFQSCLDLKFSLSSISFSLRKSHQPALSSHSTGKWQMVILSCALLEVTPVALVSLQVVILALAMLCASTWTSWVSRCLLGSWTREGQGQRSYGGRAHPASACCSLTSPSRSRSGMPTAKLWPKCRTGVWLVFAPSPLHFPYILLIRFLQLLPPLLSTHSS